MEEHAQDLATREDSYHIMSKMYRWWSATGASYMVLVEREQYLHTTFSWAPVEDMLQS